MPCPVVVLCGGIVLASSAAGPPAAVRTVWEEEAEKFAHPGVLRHGAAVVDDPLASGGRAVRIPFQPGASGWNMVFGAPRMEMRGQVLFTFHLRAEHLTPLAQGMQVMLVAHDKHTGQWAFTRQTTVYGLNLRAQGYTPITLALPAPWQADVYQPEVILTWQPGPEGPPAVLFLDKAAIAVPRWEAPLILDVETDRVRYKPGETVVVNVSLVNPTDQAADATLVGEETLGLAQRREVFVEKATLAAGQEKRVTARYTLGPEEYGREIQVRMRVGGREVAAAREFFGVSHLPLWVSAGNGPDRSFHSGRGHSFYVAPASGQDSWRDVLYFKRLRRVYFEFFSWSPGDISDLSPQEDPFPGGEGRLTYRSRQTILLQNRMIQSVGMWPVSYVNGTCWAESGYRLFQQHPEWFLYDANGEVGGYEMDGREKYRRIHDFDFDPNTYTHIFFQATLNHALPEVQEYIARQFIRCGKEMGFNGVRLDVRYLEVYPGERDFAGREVAKTYPEADRISAASVKRIKALVHQELPEFTFGYNYASPEEVKDMMATFQERCRGGAWMLDEIPCTYQEKTSPYHVWKTYVRRMTSWGDQVRKWGGVYNPYDFRRGDMKYPIDLIYSAIFRIIGGGRDYGGWYHNSRLPIGDLGAFCTRFSEFLYSTRLDWIATLKGEVDVQAAAPLWWQDMVYWNHSTQGRRQLLVHLVNPPKADEVEENPRSEIRPPVRDIQVRCAPCQGRPPQTAWLLMSEPLEPTELNEVRVLPLDLKDAAEGRVSVTVPSVLFWKTVVFQW